MTEITRTESEERAYESYLEARLQQALDNLRAVRQECSLDKWTLEQDQKVQQALQALQDARNELNTQRRQIAEAERAAALTRAQHGQRPVTPSDDIRAPHNSRTAPRAIASTGKNAAPANESTHARRASERHDTPPAATKPATSPTPKSAPVVRAAAKTSRTSVSPRRSGTAPAINPARTMPAIDGFMAVEIDTSVSPIVKQPDRAPLSTPPKAPTAKRATRETRASAVGQALAATPTENLRQRQSSMAQHLLADSAETAPPAGKVPDMPSVQGFPPKAGEAFRAAQAAKAQRIPPNPGNAQQCPHCSAMLPAQAERCGCGHELAKTSLFPEFELPAEEYAITEAFNGSPRRT